MKSCFLICLFIVSVIFLLFEFSQLFILIVKTYFAPFLLCGLTIYDKNSKHFADVYPLFASFFISPLVGCACGVLTIAKVLLVG